MTRTETTSVTPDSDVQDNPIRPDGGLGTHTEWERDWEMEEAQINMEKQLRDRADRGGRLMGGMQAPGGSVTLLLIALICIQKIMTLPL